MTDQTPKGVVALVQANVSTRKSRLLLAATELFVSGASPNSMECNVFAELFRQYIGETPLEERRRIASLLARCDFAPHDAVLTLMRDPDISVAHRVVAYSTALTPCDLVAVVGRGPEELRRAVALRGDLTAEVRTALELHSDNETLAILAEAGTRSLPAPAEIEPAAIGPAAGFSDEALAAALDDALRPLIAESPDTAAFDSSRDADAQAAAPSRAAAPMTPQALKQILAEQVAAATGAATAPETAAAAEPTRRTRPGNLAFLAADSETRARMIVQAQARVLAEVAGSGARARIEPDQGMLRCLEQAAMAHDRESFLALLSGMLDVDVATAERITLDPYGEPLAVALASLGMSTSRTTGVMIQISPAVPDVDRLRAIAALRSNLDPRAARLIARDWRQVADEATAIETQTAHQPLLDASERPRRTGAVDQSPADKAGQRGKADVLVLRDVAN